MATDTLTTGEFVAKHCVGKQYDSCVSSPCQYASAGGCTHPLHPKNQPVMILLDHGTKARFDHGASRWVVRPAGRRDWMPVTEEASKAVGFDRARSKFGWYDLVGKFVAAVVDGELTDLQRVVVR